MDSIYSIIASYVIITMLIIVCGSLIVRLLGGAKVIRDSTHTPSVTVMMSCFNEGEAVYHTIHSVLNSFYPGILKIVVIDDCSKDDSWEWIQKAAKGNVKTDDGRI